MEWDDNIEMHMRALIDWIEWDLQHRPEAFDEPRREENKPVPPADEHGYWVRRSDGGLHYHAYDPAFEDDDRGWV